MDISFHAYANISNLPLIMPVYQSCYLQLLKMLDDGQAVDLSGLTNEHVAAYLQHLFKALLLHKNHSRIVLLARWNLKKKPCKFLVQPFEKLLFQDSQEVDRFEARI